MSFQVILFIVLAISVVALLAVMQLLGLHLYLIYHGLTTYTWIVGRRDRSTAKTRTQPTSSTETKNVMTNHEGSGKPQNGTRGFMNGCAKSTNKVQHDGHIALTTHATANNNSTNHPEDTVITLHEANERTELPTTRHINVNNAFHETDPSLNYR